MPNIYKTKPLAFTLVAALLALGAGIWAWSPVPGEARAAEAGTGALAIVEGVALTEEDVRRVASDDLEELELHRLQFEANYSQQRHQVLEQALDRLIRERLVELEADARGVSPAELVAQEVEAHISEPTDEEVDAWWQANRARVRAQREQVEPQIRQLLRQQKQERVWESFIERLEERYEVVNNMGPLRFDVEVGDSPRRGPQEAPVTLVEFSDFQCAFCARLQPTLEQVAERYGDRVRLVFRNFPLDRHQHAFKAAQAALCANEQGKFWEMKRRMFQDQNNLGEEGLRQKAAELGLDGGAFETCLESERYAQRVKNDLRAGLRYGVTGTPAVFVNGRPLSGAVPFEELARIIEEELEREAG